ncbi:hypothetical protein [Natronobiforma cellulositropha]|uniref:hypothetical protein n=1 Tax=Natronobiforma cellulositropha TaxID=1679076 RepID=UPI0021D5A712|nr:hypothetical protein [Natronobiforma cellulositropha]
MKWRCTWCGKPHESNDPPCDSCGHGTFEEAVVREQEFETVDTGTQYMWVCSNCGRQHVKNNPPCSRCGEHDLEKVEQSYEDIESDLAAPSWLEVARPYAPIILVFALVVGLFVTGVVSPSVIPGIGTPTVSDVPGDGDVSAGIDLVLVGEEVHERLETERGSDAERSYGGGLGDLAAYANHQDVVEHYGDERPSDPSTREFDLSCSRSTIVGGQLGPLSESITAFENEAALATEITESLAGSTPASVTDARTEALDVHVGPDGTVFVYYLVC